MGELIPDPILYKGQAKTMVYKNQTRGGSAEPINYSDKIGLKSLSSLTGIEGESTTCDGQIAKPTNCAFASETVRLERLDDSLDKVRELMKRWGHLDAPRMKIPDVSGWEDELE